MLIHIPAHVGQRSLIINNYPLAISLILDEGIKLSPSQSRKAVRPSAWHDGVTILWETISQKPKTHACDNGLRLFLTM